MDATKQCPDTGEPCDAPTLCGDEGCRRQVRRPPQHVWRNGRCVCGARLGIATLGQRCPGPQILR
jgi:hypothetical protein